MVLLILAAAIIVIAVGLIIYGRWNFGTLEKMGIPVVKHHPFLGSTRELYENVGPLQDIEWMKKYGRIFGVYLGRTPQIFVCDAELVRLICVRDAEHFNDRRHLDFGDPLLNEMPDFQPPEKWKLVRSMTTPAFSSSKIKMMSLPMREATQDFVKYIKDKIQSSKSGRYENVPFDLHLHAMLTDLITRCVFSITISNPYEVDNHFAKLVKQIVSPTESRNPKELVFLTETFPFLKIFMDATCFDPAPCKEFTKIFKGILEERKKSGEVKNDVVDLCLEWYEKLDTPEYKSAQITEMTLMCQIIVYFFAGQDQISTIIACVLYHMAKDPKIEEKVYEEIDRVFAKHDGKIEHEHLQELVYLQGCLNESLRLYPFFYRAERLCTKDWTNEEHGITIKKGAVVQMPIWAINRNPDYVENPDTFDPTRWLPGKKEKLNIFSATSFGHGRRSCTGKPFATEALPMVSAYLLKDLKFIARENTKLMFTPGGPFFATHDPIYFDIEERN